ncbi:penicillin-binding protein 1C [Tenacibaculum geojense]|uniref:peptidoglycan glycosyltransferase n=1 Tax=Tenacibaculum geojense TaxID=915352 RepID=A0ABW3JPJ3_9FLAO
MKNKKVLLYFAILLGVVFYYFSLPKQLFKTPTSTVVTAKNNELLGAVIAEDGQWRFPELDSVPLKFKHCILQFEDAYFEYHPGFNPLSIVKSLITNIKAKKVVRGGSTLTQQVIRLSRNHKGRTYLEKIKELILATRLEFGYSKKEILNLYASHAPYGGNVVGLEMASWRYFGLQPHQLSWAETATLAVLPNAPSLIYPGKNQERLKKKRDKLLYKLYQRNIIDSLTYSLALEENLPQKPYKLPQIAPHFVQKVHKNYQGKRLQSSIDIYLQHKINSIANKHYQQLKQNEVYNMAIMVVEVSSRKVLAYIGNSPTDSLHHNFVDNVEAPRSTGSVLKPFLYAQMLQTGELLPTQLVADVPTEIAGYTPKNFNLSFDGAVPANEALTRSLNIPAVRMLRSYGLAKFRADLQDYQLKHITKPADYYGLSLILGGAEASLWDVTKSFAAYASIINHYDLSKFRYYKNEFLNPFISNDAQPDYGKLQEEYETIDAGTAYTTLETLTEVNRPETEVSWKYFDSAQKIAWKTGTSFGNKDAWAVGTTPKYAVGVWVGNSDGEGRPELTGVGSAGPILFDVFDALPKSDWFTIPYENLTTLNVCKKSGYLALPICESEEKLVPINGIKASPCPYHQLIQVDNNEQYRVNANCVSAHQIKSKPWFVLPPLMALYYQQHNSDYVVLPNFKQGCEALSNHQMEFIFPTKYKSEMSLTKKLDGSENSILLKLTHQNQHAEVFWYINENFIKKTTQYHELPFAPSKGFYKVTAVDNFGNEEVRLIDVKN